MKPTISLTFLPRTIKAPPEYVDHQLLQAVFAAAQAVIGVSGNLQTIGDPAIVIPADMGGRVMSTRWRHDNPQTILEHMLELNPGIRVLVHGQLDQGEVEQKIRALAIDVITSGDASKDMGGDALDLVRQLCQYTEAWRDGAAALAREGLLEVGAGTGPGEFYVGLRKAIAYLLDTRAERAQEAGQERTRRVEGEARIDELGAEVARLTGELAATRATAGRLEADVAVLNGQADPAIAALDDFKAKRADDLLQVRGIATDAALMVLDTLNPRAEGQPPHAIRVHMPGAGLLRVIVAADVTDDVLAELEAEVDDKVAERVTSISIEREPGGLPEGQGYEIKEHVDGNGEDGEGPTGVHPGSPATEEWMVYHWENAELDDAGQGRKSKAEAIDDVWCDYATVVLDAAEVRGEGDGE